MVRLLAIVAVVFLIISAAGVVAANNATSNIVWLDSLNLDGVTQGYGTPQVNRSVEGNPIRIGGVSYERGIGTHANCLWPIDLKKSAKRFEAYVGVDDEKPGQGSIVFKFRVDDKLVATTGLMKGGDKAKFISFDLTGADSLELEITDGGDSNDCDHADFADAKIILADNASQQPCSYLYTPGPAPKIASSDPNKLSINGPRIVGASPLRDFLFLIPATGKGNLKFSAEGLPKGLRLDKSSGIISGQISNAGEYKVKLTVQDNTGKVSRNLKIVCADRKLALTPPMGWNSWNVWGTSVSAEKVRDAADWMVKSGLAAHGFQYINIDDAWEADRDANGEILTNEKFSDMKALVDYVHSKGLKIGIYSSPGKRTCCSYTGSYQHEEQDAKTYAKWGIDYLKYDLCSYWEDVKGNGLEDMQKPYHVMRAALNKVDRDIVFSICEYGVYDVWKWGAEVGGNCWRTTGDITDTWASMSTIGFGQNGHEVYAGPGHWNDPDMLVVGNVGWGPNLHHTKLSPDEQLTHITLWSMLCSPLLLGCDLSSLDQFTTDLLTNDEVIAVNQDPLGVQAKQYTADRFFEVWAKPLYDGTMAVALFNKGLKPTTVRINWSELNIACCNNPVRDLWQKKNLGFFRDGYSSIVPAHGAVFIQVGKPAKTSF